mgnify:CR=1 FL=1
MSLHGRPRSFIKYTTIEICFYKEKTDTEFLEVSRGVSGNVTLGDLYNKTEFVTTNAVVHYQNDVVYNVSNLFLYALVKSFENEYLGAFPEKYLKKLAGEETLEAKTDVASAATRLIALLFLVKGIECCATSKVQGDHALAEVFAYFVNRNSEVS